MDRIYAVPIVIPAYEPGTELLEFYRDLKTKGFQNIIVINDGSTDDYTELFDEITARGGSIKTCCKSGKRKGVKNGI